MTTFEIYLLTTLLPNINSALNIVGWSALAVLCVCGILIIMLDFDDDAVKDPKKWAPYLLAVFFACLILSTPIPNTKQMMLLAGGYMVNNSETIKQLPDAAANALLDYFKDTVKDAEKEQK